MTELGKRPQPLLENIECHGAWRRQPIMSVAGDGAGPANQQPTVRPALAELFLDGPR